MVRTLSLRVFGLALSLFVLRHAAAAEHAVVPAFERFYQDDQSDVVRGGEFLFGELNCVACHKADQNAAARLIPKVAPHLDAVGGRARLEFLREFIANPHQVKPGSTMPDLFAGVPDGERQQQVEALVHFLSLTGTIADTLPSGQSVKNGEKLFHEIGCVACHDSRLKSDMPLATSVPLGHVGKKYSVPGLIAFLNDPLAVRPSGRMPHMNLKPEESRDIASYLLKEVKVFANLRYDYYEGTWDKLPDFSKLKPKSSGQASGFDPNVGRDNNFAVRFSSYVQIPKEGQYRVYLSSDDGSRMFIDGTEVANVDGIHPLQEAVGRAFLGAGPHELVVEFFQGGGGAELKVEIEGNGIKRQLIDSLLTLTKEPIKNEPNAPAAFTADPALAEKGKQLFANLGCASCHQLGKQPLKPSNDVLLQPPTLAQLKGTGGCLAEKPAPGAPRFALNARQRDVLSRGIASLKKPANAPQGEERIARTMAAMNCYACHERGKIGGVEEVRNAMFKSNQPEMGDEGRIPPHLNGVGAKLTEGWLKEVMNNGAKERPYMFTRMPKFGGANVGHLVAAVQTADPERAFQRPGIEMTDAKLKAIGRKLVGAQGMSCIKCHTWDKVPATGIQSISMTSMNKRLREAWFHQYLLEPQIYRPGTRMPQGWPNGQTFYPDLLDGSVQKQIQSVWAFLSDGTKGQIPVGMGRDPIELLALTEPVIYRNFIEGVGPRAIGVGYPERVNVAWDANDMRLATIWQGSFIDAGRHWRDRGTGFQPPLGDNIVPLAKGATFARLEKPDSPWPGDAPKTIGYQFKGYRLDAALRPIFQYTFAELQVEDEIVPVKNGNVTVLRRTLTLTAPNTAPVTNLFFRAATGKKIEAAGQGTYKVDSDYQLRMEASDSPMVRAAGSGAELLVPIRLNNGKAKITQEFAW